MKGEDEDDTLKAIVDPGFLDPALWILDSDGNEDDVVKAIVGGSLESACAYDEWGPGSWILDCDEDDVVKAIVGGRLAAGCALVTSVERLGWVHHHHIPPAGGTHAPKNPVGRTSGGRALVGWVPGASRMVAGWQRAGARGG